MNHKNTNVKKSRALSALSTGGIPVPLPLLSSGPSEKEKENKSGRQTFRKTGKNMQYIQYIAIHSNTNKHRLSTNDSTCRQTCAVGSMLIVVRSKVSTVEKLDKSKRPTMPSSPGTLGMCRCPRGPREVRKIEKVSSHITTWSFGVWMYLVGHTVGFRA